MSHGFHSILSLIRDVLQRYFRARASSFSLLVFHFAGSNDLNVVFLSEKAGWLLVESMFHVHGRHRVGVDSKSVVHGLDPLPECSPFGLTLPVHWMSFSFECIYPFTTISHYHESMSDDWMVNHLSRIAYKRDLGQRMKPLNATHDRYTLIDFAQITFGIASGRSGPCCVQLATQRNSLRFNLFIPTTCEANLHSHFRIFHFSPPNAPRPTSP
jgi:hypothetical protein